MNSIIVLTPPKQKEFYLANHLGNPDTFPSEPNAELCEFCHREIQRDLSKLHMARLFSRRNGYGPIPVPRFHENMSPQQQLAYELDDLLKSLTVAEEIAISPITAFQRLVWLNRGNIATKGNTSCVWKDSKLEVVLPHLPEHCKIIVIQWSAQQDNANNNLRSYQYKRYKIQMALEMLRLTGLECWLRVIISDDNLLAWDEEGSLLQHPNVVHVDNQDYEADDQNVVDTMSLGLNHDGGDAGPALLQNGEAPEELVEGVIPQDTSTSVGAATAVDADVQLEKAVDLIQHNLHLRPKNFNTNPNEDRPVRFSEDGSTLYLQQDNVVRHNNFVDMRKEKFAWHYLFPTVFRPALHNDSFVVLGDPTACGFDRDKPMDDYSAWHHYCMWRSDGAPARHPTCALAMISEKFKKALFGQGRVALNTDDTLDPNITAEDFLTRWNSGEEAQNKFRKRLLYYCGNVPGTGQYWNSKGKEFLATAMRHSVIEKKEPTIFHTVSHAEFNDPHLRRLMARYVAKITNDADMEQNIMVENAAWAQSIHKYKNVVTHYFACKLELWIICFLVPVLNLRPINETKEFGSSRGAILSYDRTY